MPKTERTDNCGGEVIKFPDRLRRRFSVDVLASNGEMVMFEATIPSYAFDTMMHALRDS